GCRRCSRGRHRAPSVRSSPRRPGSRRGAPSLAAPASSGWRTWRRRGQVAFESSVRDVGPTDAPAAVQGYFAPSLPRAETTYGVLGTSLVLLAYLIVTGWTRVLGCG